MKCIVYRGHNATYFCYRLYAVSFNHNCIHYRESLRTLHINLNDDGKYEPIGEGVGYHYLDENENKNVLFLVVEKSILDGVLESK